MGEGFLLGRGAPYPFFENTHLNVVQCLNEKQQILKFKF